ncbi:MAG: ABC transporter ATP-binding protein [Acidobacteriales bacterium]|nr:ABC transporter ATP-binding protein [Terriglobales bacterium]
MTSPLLSVSHLKKVFRTGRQELVLFDDLSFQVPAGEMLAIIGESGCGKSTLLHLLGALDHPTAGEIHFEDTAVHGLHGDAASDFRSRRIGYVWQFHYLLPEFTAQENVAMPLLMRNGAKQAALQSAGEWLDKVGLSDRADHRTGELSGGEQQRVALARALITGPRLLLADEPTGDLDTATAQRVFGLIEQLHRQLGLTSIIVTHLGRIDI